jgi:hypothetical protein
VRPPLQLNAVRPVSDHAEHRVDAAVAELLERDQHVVRAFHRRHPPDPADGEPVVGDAEVAAALGTTVLFAGDALVELDAEPDHHEALARRDAQGDEIVTHLRTDGDQSCRTRGEPALEQPEG